ncbi:MAG: hypothetical protein RLY20_490 [Verrucomicrobiota bacterium]|jgi:hypothetical protein
MDTLGITTQWQAFVRIRAGLLMAIALFASAASGWCATGSDELAATKLEYQVKAGYIYNFATKFVDWPTNGVAAGTTFRIAVLGEESAFNVISNVLAGKSIEGRPIEVVPARSSDLPGAFRVVFVCRSQSSQAASVRKQVGDLPVLTIGESDGFAADGGCINFIRKGDNIRFEINLAVVERARLKVSAKLAAIATLVKSKGDKP